MRMTVAKFLHVLGSICETNGKTRRRRTLSTPVAGEVNIRPTKYKTFDFVKFGSSSASSNSRPKQNLATSVTIEESSARTESTSSTSVATCGEESHSTKSSLRDFFTVLALSFHAVFEGLAIGLESETKDVWMLFAGSYKIHASSRPGGVD